jgi:hypothetical protein
MNFLYANGDSFVFGMECVGDGSTEERNKEYAFPKQLTNRLNCATYINNAYNGATNEFIFRNTIFDLLDLEKQGVDPHSVFVLVGWTSLHRTEIVGDSWYNKIPNYRHNEAHLLTSPDAPGEFRDFKTLFVNPSSENFVMHNNIRYSTQNDITPFCVDFLWHDHLQSPQQQAHIIALHEFLKSRGYRHLFVNTCSNHEFDLIDSAVPNYYQLADNSFYTWAVANYKQEHRLKNHFSPIPHAAYGDMLFDYVAKNKL